MLVVVKLEKKSIRAVEGTSSAAVSVNENVCKPSRGRSEAEGEGEAEIEGVGEGEEEGKTDGEIDIEGLGEDVCEAELDGKGEVDGDSVAEGLVRRSITSTFSSAVTLQQLDQDWGK